MPNPTRATTCQLIEACEEGTLDWETVGRAALGYLSEADVTQMSHANELIFEPETNICPDCEGTGYDVLDSAPGLSDECERCDGAGEVFE